MAAPKTKAEARREIKNAAANNKARGITNGSKKAAKAKAATKASPKKPSGPKRTAKMRAAKKGKGSAGRSH